MRVAMLGVSHWHAGFHADAAKCAGAEIGAVFGTRTGRRRLPSPPGTAATPSTTPEAALAGTARSRCCAGAWAGERGAGRTLLEHPVPLLVDKPLGLSEADVAPLAERASPPRPFRHGRVGQPDRADRGGDRRAAARGSRARFRTCSSASSTVRRSAIATGACGGCSTRGRAAAARCAISACTGWMLSCCWRASSRCACEHAAFGRGVHGEGVDEYALVVLRAADGMLGVVEAGYTHADPRAGHLRMACRRAAREPGR